MPATRATSGEIALPHQSPVLHQPVRLSAYATGDCATNWEVAIEFRPLKRRFSVWEHTTETVNESRAAGRHAPYGWMPFAKRGASKNPLTWSEIVEWVRGCYELDGLGGSGLIENVWVEGDLPTFACSLASIAWVRWENEFEGILDDMLTRPDDEIAACWAVMQGFAQLNSAERHERLDELLAEAIEDLQPTGREPDAVIYHALVVRRTIHLMPEARDAPIENLEWWSRELFFREQPGPVDLGVLEDALRLRLGLPEREAARDSAEATTPTDRRSSDETHSCSDVRI